MTTNTTLRQRLLKQALVGAALAGSLALGACGNDQAGTPTTTTQAPASQTATTQASSTTTAPESTATATTTVTDEPSSAPASTEQQSQAPESSAPATTAKPVPSQKEQKFINAGTATFTYFTVSNIVDEAPKVEKVEGVVGYYVKVCVNKLPPGFEDKGEVPVNASAFRLEAFPGKHDTRVVKERAYQPAYPFTKNLKVGQCAQGYVSFREPTGHIDGANLIYENSVGEKASWNNH